MAGAALNNEVIDSFKVRSCSVRLVEAQIADSSYHIQIRWACYGGFGVVMIHFKRCSFWKWPWGILSTVVLPLMPWSNFRVVKFAHMTERSHSWRAINLLPALVPKDDSWSKMENLISLLWLSWHFCKDNLSSIVWIDSKFLRRSHQVHHMVIVNFFFFFLRF